MRNEGPWIPGKAARFELPDRGDPDLALVRGGVQEGAPGLYVMYLPFTVGGAKVKCLVEAYYPEDLRPDTWNEVDPRQRTDWVDGRLVALHTIDIAGTFKVGGSTMGSVYAFMNLNEVMIEELRRNNRNARTELKRKSSTHARELELRNAIEANEEKIIDNCAFVDAYVEAHENTKAKLTPTVSQYQRGDR